MLYHADLFGNKVESVAMVEPGDGDFAVANCPSEEVRKDMVNQYFSEVRAGKRQIGQTIFCPVKGVRVGGVKATSHGS